MTRRLHITTSNWAASMRTTLFTHTCNSFPTMPHMFIKLKGRSHRRYSLYQKTKKTKIIRNVNSSSLLLRWSTELESNFVISLITNVWKTKFTLETFGKKRRLFLYIASTILLSSHWFISTVVLKMSYQLSQWLKESDRIISFRIVVDLFEWDISTWP